MGVASGRRFLAKETEDIDALPRGGLEGNADGAGERKTVGEDQVLGAPERARTGDLAAIDDPCDGVDGPVLALGDASIVPLPGKGTPPRSGAGPVNDQSKTLALGASDAAASGSKPPIITAANVVANFID
jgi:hypothetical protein